MVLVKVSGLWGTSAALAEGIPTDPPKPGILRASHHQIPHRPMVSLHDIWPLETQYMNYIALIWIHIISHTWTVSEHYTLGSLLLHQLCPNAHQGHFSQAPRVLPCWRNGPRLARSGFRKDTFGAVGVGSQNQKLDIFWELGGWPPFFPFWGLWRGSSDCWYMLALMGGIWYFFCFFLFFFCLELDCEHVYDQSDFMTNLISEGFMIISIVFSAPPRCTALWPWIPKSFHAKNARTPRISAPYAEVGWLVACWNGWSWFQQVDGFFHWICRQTRSEKHGAPGFFEFKFLIDHHHCCSHVPG